jgi:hypothetical protein
VARVLSKHPNLRPYEVKTVLRAVASNSVASNSVASNAVASNAAAPGVDDDR